MYILSEKKILIAYKNEWPINNSLERVTSMINNHLPCHKNINVQQIKKNKTLNVPQTTQGF